MGGGRIKHNFQPICGRKDGPSKGGVRKSIQVNSSQAKPSQAKSSQVKLSQGKSSQVKASQVGEMGLRRADAHWRTISHMCVVIRPRDERGVCKLEGFGGERPGERPGDQGDGDPRPSEAVCLLCGYMPLRRGAAMARRRVALAVYPSSPCAAWSHSGK